MDLIDGEAAVRRYSVDGGEQRWSRVINVGGLGRRADSRVPRADVTGRRALHATELSELNWVSVS
jgi:hypothetical protein